MRLRPNPAGELTAFPQIPWLYLKGCFAIGKGGVVSGKGGKERVERERGKKRTSLAAGLHAPKEGKSSVKSLLSRFIAIIQSPKGAGVLCPEGGIGASVSITHLLPHRPIPRHAVRT